MEKMTKEILQEQHIASLSIPSKPGLVRTSLYSPNLPVRRTDSELDDNPGWFYFPFKLPPSKLYIITNTLVYKAEWIPSCKTHVWVPDNEIISKKPPISFIQIHWMKVSNTRVISRPAVGQMLLLHMYFCHRISSLAL